MKKASLYFIIIVFSVSVTHSQNSAPSEANIITSDIDLFWECYDSAKPKFKAKYFAKYLEEGSAGVQGFIRYRIESATGWVFKLQKPITCNKKTKNKRCGTY